MQIGLVLSLLALLQSVASKNSVITELQPTWHSTPLLLEARCDAATALTYEAGTDVTLFPLANCLPTSTAPSSGSLSKPPSLCMSCPTTKVSTVPQMYALGLIARGTAVYERVLEEAERLLDPLAMDIFKVSTTPPTLVGRADGVRVQLNLAARSASPAVEMFFQTSDEAIRAHPEV